MHRVGHQVLVLVALQPVVDRHRDGAEPVDGQEARRRTSLEL